ncbi:hypothetical protein [Bifidobacterium aquikefiri]|uniref:hypothetical protein n=1 Tax=Bifidobacterium aquikefiri TaxID=1653207 RepID=UPI0023F2C3F0|nr:hypothetical protein [Bifidobacterium aquikefiri]
MTQPNNPQFNAQRPQTNQPGVSQMPNQSQGQHGAQPGPQPNNRQPNMMPPNFVGYPYQQYPNRGQSKSAAKGFAIAGFILALIGLFVVVWQYNRFVSPFGTVGLVLSVVGILIPEKGEERSRATYIFAVVGVIVSIIVIVVNLLMGIYDYQPSVY